MAFLAAQLSFLDNVSGGQGAALVEPLGLYFPALLAGGWVLFMLLNGGFAQWLVHRFDLEVRPSIGLADIELPGWPVAVLAALVVTSYLAEGQIGYVALNLTAAYALAFFFEHGTTHYDANVSVKDVWVATGDLIAYALVEGESADAVAAACVPLKKFGEVRYRHVTSFNDL